MLSNNYKAELVRADLKVEDITKALGISRMSFYNKKVGKSNYTAEEMKKIKDLINEKLQTDYTIEYLFWGE